MDDQMLGQLETALDATPENEALLSLLLKGYVDAGQQRRGAQKIDSIRPQYLTSPETLKLAASIFLDAGMPERALDITTGYREPRVLLQRARALLALERRAEGLECYVHATVESPALEDPDLHRSLKASVVEFRARDEGTALKVISNDDTDGLDLARVLAPPSEKIDFSDVAGLDNIKKSIHKKIILPFQKPSLFQKFRKRVGGGILMYGPPGCGKTLLARATAGECNAQFFNVAISDVLDMYQGESERKLHALFEQARSKAPSVLFFDEVEALGGKRSQSRDATTAKLVSQFLSEMDGFAQDNHGVLILAATNVPWAVDSAFRRPGRFDRVLFVPPPDKVARLRLLELLLEGRPTETRLDLSFLAEHTSGFSGADLRELVESAADEAIETTIERGSECPIGTAHLKAALKEARPTTVEWLTTARNYSKYANEAGQYDDVLKFLKDHSRG